MKNNIFLGIFLGINFGVFCATEEPQCAILEVFQGTEEEKKHQKDIEFRVDRINVLAQKFGYVTSGNNLKLVSILKNEAHKKLLLLSIDGAKNFFEYELPEGLLHAGAVFSAMRAQRFKNSNQDCIALFFKPKRNRLQKFFNYYPKDREFQFILETQTWYGKFGGMMVPSSKVYNYEQLTSEQS